MIPKNGIQDYITPPQKEIIINGLQDSKILTSHIVPMDPVYIYLDFYLQKQDEVASPDNSELTRIKITKSLNSRRADSAIKKDIESIFKKYFDRSVNKLGQMIDIYQISNTIIFYGIFKSEGSFNCNYCNCSFNHGVQTIHTWNHV